MKLLEIGLRVCTKINSHFAGGRLAVWLGVSDEHTRQRSVRSEQRRQTAKQPQPSGAGRRLAICFVARRSQPTGGDAPAARAGAPRASHLARRRSRQNRKLFLNRPLITVARRAASPRVLLRVRKSYPFLVVGQ